MRDGGLKAILNAKTEEELKHMFFPFRMYIHTTKIPAIWRFSELNINQRTWDGVDYAANVTLQ